MSLDLEKGSSLALLLVAVSNFSFLCDSVFERSSYGVREVCFASLFIVHQDGGRYGGSSGSVHGHMSLHLPRILGSR